jgi:ribosome-associated toxin RatA of RatAB toxin-antitoxin module
MTTINRSALVMHTPDKMYELVNDVTGYPQFLPWCASAEVHERSDTAQLASIEIAKAGMHKRFTTRNRMLPGQSIHLDLVEGPFRHLRGDWSFRPLGAHGCKVLLDIEFEFDSPVLSRVVGPVFSQICGGLVDAFVKRADELYGRNFPS